MPLATRHSPAFQAAFSDLKRRAWEPRELLLGTPGSVSEREVNGRRFFYRQYWDADGKKIQAYIGGVEDPEAVARATELRDRIDEARVLADDARVLGRNGYVRVDARTWNVLAALANAGLFRAGMLLVGSHAYGALLNDLGVRAAAFATEDLDVARGEALELELAEGTTFESILATSTVALHPVPQLDRTKPSTSWKAKDRFRVDLLVPTRGTELTIRGVPELHAHATGVPYLGYLVAESLPAIVLGREGAVPVLTPPPERYAWHKMLVASSRHATSDKRTKDIDHAAVLVATLPPDALEEAFRAVPSSARAKTRAGAAEVVRRLDGAGHEEAAAVLRDIV